MMDSKRGMLESLIGANDDNWDEIDERVLLSNMKAILKRRSTPESFEQHFTFFNALTLLPAYPVSEHALNLVDSALTTYILSCRTSSQADIMLADLIVDHWPLSRAVKLSRSMLYECRYRKRVDYFVCGISWVQSGLDDALRSALSEMASELGRDERISKRIVAKSVKRALNAKERS